MNAVCSQFVNKQILKFAENYSQLNKYKQLYFITGHANAGKSVLIDFLIGKKITQYIDQSVDAKMLVQSNNLAHEYPLIHIGKKDDMMFIESFTLDTNKTVTKENIIKLVYLMQLMKIVQKISFVFVIEEIELNSTIQYINHFLQIIGLTQSNSKLSKQILSSFNIIITKSEQDQLSSKIEILDSLEEEINPTTLIQTAIKENRVMQIINKEPDIQLSKTIRKNLGMSVFLNKNQFFINKNIQDVNLFDQNQQKSVVQMMQIILKIVNHIISYALNNKKSTIQYEKIVKDMFQDSKNKSSIKIMVQNWNISELGKIELQKIKDDISLRVQFFTFTELMIQLLNTFAVAKEKTRQDFKQLIGLFKFFQNLYPYINHKLFGLLTPEIQKFKKMQKPISQPAISKASKAASKKKSPFMMFCSSIEQNCKSNKDVVQYCHKIILQKINNQEKEFDSTQIVFYIKLIRELFSKSPQHHIFAQEILDLYLLNDNYYEFQITLQQFMKKQLINNKLSQALIQKLIKIKRYDIAEILVNNALKNTNKEQSFRKLNFLKAKIQQNKAKQYFARSSEKDINQDIGKDRKKKQIPFKIQILLEKINHQQNTRRYFQKDSFKQIIKKE